MRWCCTLRLPVDLCLTLVLSHVQERGSLPERQAAMLVYEVLRVVRCCHAAHILHGDIKVRLNTSRVLRTALCALNPC